MWGQKQEEERKREMASPPHPERGTAEEFTKLRAEDVTQMSVAQLQQRKHEFGIIRLVLVTRGGGMGRKARVEDGCCVLCVLCVCGRERGRMLRDEIGSLVTVWRICVLSFFFRLVRLLVPIVCCIACVLMGRVQERICR